MSTIELQRGRAFEGAEISSALVHPVNRFTLQRGRAFEGAEIMRRDAEVTELEMLQRGRAFEGAEIRRWNRFPSPTNHCFNGAALLRARRFSQSISPPSISASLQRGRAFEGAEMSLCGLFAESTVRLQRGRAFEGAEMAIVQPADPLEPGASTGPRF